MRLFLSLALLLGGAGLWLLDEVAHAFSDSAYYNKQLRSFPNKEAYTKAEVADAVWHVWTNKVSLPAQSNYSLNDLKTVVASPLLNADQDTCDRSQFLNVIASAAGYRRRTSSEIAAAGFFLMLVGSFLIGGVLLPARPRGLPGDNTTPSMAEETQRP